MVTKGLLLINLGSPQSPSRHDVKTYLDEFLMDPYVIDLPAPLRWLLVRGVITPFRAQKSAEAYKKIWTNQGSPLVEITRQFAEAVRAQLTPAWEVRWAMRYGRPAIADVVRDWEVEQVSVVPLYPQYAESSTKTALERVRAELKRNPQVTSISVLPDFFAEPEFIEAQTARIEHHRQTFAPDHILLSFHGLPQHHLTKLHPNHCLQPGKDCCARVGPENRWCYRAQAFATAAALRARLNFPKDKISIGFQSRLGRRPWIQPYTDHVIQDLARAGARRVLVSCPSFVADCLETLEEVQMRLRDQFLAEGGEALELVPAVNADPSWVDLFCRMIQRPSLVWS